MRNRFFIALSVALLAASLAACGGGKKKEATTTTTTRKITTTTTAPPVAPLTGVPEADASKRQRAAMIIKVDNVPAAFPLQEGVESADVVYVEEVENGATRMAVVFQSKDDTAGPVRSARTSDLDIAGDLNNPYFCYSGANGGVLRLVRNGPMIDMGVDRSEATRVYTRNQRGSGIHRFFLPTKEMYAVGRSGAGTPPQLFTYRAKGVKPVGELAPGMALAYGGGRATQVSYTWSATTGGWQRTQNGAAHVMADTKDRITPKNVIVQFTPYTASPFVDVTGSRSPEAELVGSGEAWIFTDGVLVKGRWSRPDRRQVTSYTDATGKAIGLTPGQTFVELIPAPGSFLGSGSAKVV